MPETGLGVPRELLSHHDLRACWGLSTRNQPVLSCLGLALLPVIDRTHSSPIFASRGHMAPLFRGPLSRRLMAWSRLAKPSTIHNPRAPGSPALPRSIGTRNDVVGPPRPTKKGHYSNSDRDSGCGIQEPARLVLTRPGQLSSFPRACP